MINPSQLAADVDLAIARAAGHRSHLPPGVLALQGMSSPKVRHLLSNLCSRPGTVYLEIGVWQGSTLVSALCGNEASVPRAYAIDNWSQFGGPREEFVRHCRRWLHGYGDRLEIIEADCFTIDPARFAGPITVFFYDGDHQYASQFRALEYYHGVLADASVLVIDDWNFPEVARATRDALAALPFSVVQEWEPSARFNGDREQWWNGLYVAVLQRRRRG